MIFIAYLIDNIKIFIFLNTKGKREEENGFLKLHAILGTSSICLIRYVEIISQIVILSQNLTLNLL